MDGSSQPPQFRSAPKGRQQMGETGFCKNLRFSAVSCENLRFPAVFCANLRLPNPLIYRASRKSAKICENVRSGSGFSLLLSPFWRALTKKKIEKTILGATLGIPRAFSEQLSKLHSRPKSCENRVLGTTLGTPKFQPNFRAPKTELKSRNITTKTAFTRAFSKSSHELLPSSM